MSTSINKLFDDAQDEGLSLPASSILVENLNALTVAGAQGASIEDLAGDEVTLFCAVVDATGSMDPHRSEVVYAYNQMLDAVSESKASDSILFSSWMFNTMPRLLHSYQTLDNVSKLTLSDYVPDDLTALFDATLHSLTSVVAYGQDLRNNGIRTKVVVVIFTDGDDNASRTRVEDVRVVVESLLKQEYYILALVAFGSGFAQQVANEMGIPNFLEVNADPGEIRKAMGTVSKSVIRASQTKIDPSKSSSFFS